MLQNDDELEVPTANAVQHVLFFEHVVYTQPRGFTLRNILRPDKQCLHVKASIMNMVLGLTLSEPDEPSLSGHCA